MNDLLLFIYIYIYKKKRKKERKCIKSEAKKKKIDRSIKVQKNYTMMR